MSAKPVPTTIDAVPAAAEPAKPTIDASPKTFHPQTNSFLFREPWPFLVSWGRNIERYELEFTQKWFHLLEANLILGAMYYLSLKTDGYFGKMLYGIYLVSVTLLGSTIQTHLSKVFNRNKTGIGRQGLRSGLHLLWKALLSFGILFIIMNIADRFAATQK